MSAINRAKTYLSGQTILFLPPLPPPSPPLPPFSLPPPKSSRNPDNSIDTHIICIFLVINVECEMTNEMPATTTPGQANLATRFFTSVQQLLDVNPDVALRNGILTPFSRAA